ncbi:MAG: MFS transporter [Acidimicrobiia bacterium]|nr:MFS transporter [Acidimicrobiia bacterium]
MGTDRRRDGSAAASGGPDAPGTRTRVPGRFGRPRSRVLRSFRHPAFRVVWGTLLVGHLGFWISFLALQALMARLTDGEASWQGVLFFANFVPLLVFTPFAGVVADRVERRKILLVGHGAVGVTATALAVAVLTDRIGAPGLLPFAFAIGTAFSFTAPANHAMVANTVPAADLASAVSLQSAGSNLSRVVGPALAAPILALLDEGAAFAIYGGTSVFVVVVLSRIHIEPHRRSGGSAGYWASLAEGLRHARDRPPAVAALTILAVSSLFAGGYLAFLPVVAEDVFGRGPTGLTTLAAASGLGSMVGALTTGLREETPSLAAVAALVAGFGASVVAFGANDHWGLALVLVAIVGGFGFAAMTTLNTLLQRLADDAMRGRLMALFTVGWGGLVPIGALWQGAFARGAGVQAALVVAGAVTACYSPLAVVVTRARTRRASVVAEAVPAPAPGPSG